MGIKQFFKSKNIQSAFIAAVIAAVISTIGILVNYNLVKESNALAKEANNISKEIFKSKNIPRVIASPISAKFYIPEQPEVPGQVKINISAMIENLSEVNAREVAINFETKDWYEHKTSLFDIYKESNMPILHILSLPKNSRILYPSYAPDAPSSGEDGFVNQNKPFKVKITLYWKDINNKEYVYVGLYDLKSTILPNNERQLYFQPINTYDSVKDKNLAWDYAKKTL